MDSKNNNNDNDNDNENNNNNNNNNNNLTLRLALVPTSSLQIRNCVQCAEGSEKHPHSSYRCCQCWGGENSERATAHSRSNYLYSSGEHHTIARNLAQRQQNMGDTNHEG